MQPLLMFSTFWRRNTPTRKYYKNIAKIWTKSKKHPASGMSNLGQRNVLLCYGSNTIKILEIYTPPVLLPKPARWINFVGFAKEENVNEHPASSTGNQRDAPPEMTFRRRHTPWKACKKIYQQLGANQKHPRTKRKIKNSSAGSEKVQGNKENLLQFVIS